VPDLTWRIARANRVIAVVSRSIQLVLLMTWRQVIHQYLMACAEDFRRMSPVTSETRFITEHGTTSLGLREREYRTQADKLRAAQQWPLPETYKVIEESPTRVIADLQNSKLIELFCATRFVVVSIDNEWKLDDTFLKCSCENGDCFFCDGTGYCRVCYRGPFARWFFGLVKERCGFCQGKPKCKYCDATGRCVDCFQSPFPGWRSRMSVLPEDEVSG
jgi:hypothetical protein